MYICTYIYACTYICIPAASLAQAQSTPLAHRSQFLTHRNCFSHKSCLRGYPCLPSNSTYIMCVHQALVGSLHQALIGAPINRIYICIYIYMSAGPLGPPGCEDPIADVLSVQCPISQVSMLKCSSCNVRCSNGR